MLSLAQRQAASEQLKSIRRLLNPYNPKGEVLFGFQGIQDKLNHGQSPTDCELNRLWFHACSFFPSERFAPWPWDKEVAYTAFKHLKECLS